MLLQKKHSFAVRLSCAALLPFALSPLALITAEAATVTVAETDVQFYGRVHVSTDYLHDGDDGGFNVSSNSSRLGVRLSHQIADGLELQGQVERGVDWSNNNAVLKARNTYIGVKGNWGTLRAGYYGPPTKSILSLVEEFQARVGEARNILVQGAGSLDRRLNNSVYYQAPELQGMTFSVQYSSNHTEKGVVEHETDTFNTGLTYRTGSWTLAGAYQKDNSQRQQSTEGMRLAVARQGKGWRIAGLAQYVSGLTGDNQVATSMRAWGLSGRYQLSADYWLRGQVFGRTYKNLDKDSVMLTLGVDRKLTPQLTWYFVGTHTQNDTLAFGNISGGGYGKPIEILPSNDPFAFGTGIEFNF